ncbi:MAG: carboxypeptidase-like regulatory domain-containing protein, partial [Acidobacteriota bacterium]
SGEDDYVDEFWQDQPCFGNTCSFLSATPVVLELGETAAAVDFSLQRGSSIAGTVRNAATGEPLAFSAVQLRNEDGDIIAATSINSAGSYLFEGLSAGTYFVSSAARGYVDEIWPGVRCGFAQNCPTDGATPLVVGAEAVDGIDFDLDLGGTFSARVRQELTGARVDDGFVGLYDGSDNLLAFLPSFDGIQVEFSGLAGGVYRALAMSESGDFAAELYRDLDCPGGPETCAPIASGSPINVVEGETTNVAFTLEPSTATCQSDAYTLCVNEGRFAVGATWRTPAGNEGRAVAAPLSGLDDSGAFYFFDSENTELVVKVLDACAEPSNRFWVFAAGLTNVEVELTVEDTEIGERKTYTNPLGAAFQPIQDTDAFATCLDAGTGPPVSTAPVSKAPAGSPGVDPAPEAVSAELDAALRSQRLAAAARAIDAERAAAPTSSPTAKASCEPSATALCLGEGGRFRVEAT